MTVTQEQLEKQLPRTIPQDLHNPMSSPRAAPAPFMRVPRDGELPLSFSQQRLWFLDQYEQGSAAYNVVEAFHVRGPLDATALEQSLNEVVRRHEALRTTFTIAAGQPKQTLRPSLAIPLRRIDLRNVDASAREAGGMRVCTAEARRPFDLAKGPLLRALLIQLDAQDFILLLTTHHIVSDGWSLGVLMRELKALYTAFAKGQPSPLAELKLQYADYAYWQRQLLQGDYLESQLAYWRKQLEGSLPVLELPGDHSRPAIGEPTIRSSCPV